MPCEQWFLQAGRYATKGLYNSWFSVNSTRTRTGRAQVIIFPRNKRKWRHLTFDVSVTWTRMLDGKSNGCSQWLLSLRSVACVASGLEKPLLAGYSPYRHLAMTDIPVIRKAAKSQAKNKLQTFDWHKLPLLRTLADKDKNSRSLQCPQ